MKRLFALLLGTLLIFTLVACGGNETPPPSDQTLPSSSNDNQPSSTPASESQQPSGNEQPNNEDADILVVYFSMPETTDPNNMTTDEDNSVVVIDGQVLGNTQYVAQLIAENTGADIFRIEPKTPYPTDHSTLVDLADKEQDENARPELMVSIENLDQYDVIFLGYPNWWGDMPMILYTFLESHDLSGKTIIPFNTHGGSGFSNTINTIARLQPNAAVNEDGFTVSRNNVEDCADDVAAWLENQNLLKK